MSENFVLPEAEFVVFQEFCRNKGFNLCYFGDEISGSQEEIENYHFDNPRVIKMIPQWFSYKGIPYDVAEYQKDKWSMAIAGLRGEFFAGRKNEIVGELNDVGKQ